MINHSSTLVLGTFLFGTLPLAYGAMNVDAAAAAIDRRRAAASLVGDWPAASASAARRLIGQYGAPDEVHADWLVWNGNRPWARTIVRSSPPFGSGAGFVEQAVEYPLTMRQAAALKAFDERLVYDRRNRELSSSSEREETNFLRLNLANDIVNGRMTPDQARELFAQILRLEAAGKSSSYLEVLHFQH